MWFYLLTTIFVLALGALALIGRRQLVFVRTNDWPAEVHPELELRDLLQRKIDSSYLRFADFFRHLVKLVCLFVLLVLRRVTAIGHGLLHRSENRFSRLIDLVHGREVPLKRGAASIFLTRLNEPQEPSNN